MSVAAVVLAAGASRRLGRPKQSVLFAGETLVQRTVRTAQNAGLAPVIIVTRKAAEHLGFAISQHVIIAVNSEADEGIASSIRSGIAAASSTSVAGAVLLTCDQPALHAAHLRALIEDLRRVTGSRYAGSIGIPAFFPAQLFPSLLQLRGDTGARSLLQTAHTIEADELSLDIDTDEDLERARSLFERRTEL